MEFYEVLKARHTVRRFTGEAIEDAVLHRILQAGLTAPSNDHLRQWEFVVIRGKENIARVLGKVTEQGKMQQELLKSRPLTESQQKMYDHAVPNQYRMLSDSGCLILPFFRQNADVLHPAALQHLNSFASIWCCIENILLAAAAEGLGCSLRIPVGEEWQFVAKEVGAPEGYLLPCYLGLGHPDPTETLPRQHPVSLEEKLHLEQW